MEWGSIIGGGTGGLLSLAAAIYVSRKVVAYTVHVNSKMDRLLEEVQRRALSEGHAAGIAEERIRTEEMRQTVREEKREIPIPPGTALIEETPEPPPSGSVLVRLVPKKDGE